MTQFAILSNTENSYSPTGAPAAIDIETVLKQAMVNSGADLVGERARITRRGGLLDNAPHPLTPGNSTTVAWLVSAAGPQTLQGLVSRWDNALARLSGDWTGTRVSPLPTVDSATLAWWRDLQHGASVTRTRDGFSTLNTDVWENPLGPTTDETHPTTTPDSLSALLWPLALLFTGGAILYGVALVAAQSFTARPTVVITPASASAALPARARANPSRPRNSPRPRR